MNAYISRLNEIVTENHRSYDAAGGDIHWVSPYRALELEAERDSLLGLLEGSERVEFPYGGTKVLLGELSQGCRLCAEGSWSCLFISNLCNAACLFCPSRQDSEETPATQGNHFEDPRDYADYVNFFAFRGVSISGGEPLLRWDKSRAYLQAVREACDPGIYTWLYTNGMTGRREQYEEMRDLGLNELRFNLAASGYDTRLISAAAGCIPNITVEIPSIPEDHEKLKALIPELLDRGVSRLHLHQLRLTPWNARRLSRRNYTFLHGDPPTVAESELTALKMMLHLLETDSPMHLNYCNYRYKNAYQKAGFRRTLASRIHGIPEEVTAMGYIRQQRFQPVPAAIPGKGSAAILSLEDYSLLNYRKINFGEHNEAHPDSGRIQIGPKLYAFLDRPVLEEAVLGAAEFEALKDSVPDSEEADELRFRIRALETPDEGLGRYF